MKAKDKHTNSRPDHCPNCGHHFEEIPAFCPSCGQKTGQSLLSLNTLLVELFSGWFNLDNKVLKTLRELFVPGKLTSEFFAGRRNSYTHPLRFYLFISFVLFALIGYQFDKAYKGSRIYEALDTRSAIKEKKRLAELDSLTQRINKQVQNEDYGNGASALLYLYFLQHQDTLALDTMNNDLSGINLQIPHPNQKNGTALDSLIFHYRSNSTEFRQQLQKYRPELDQKLLSDSLNLIKAIFNKPISFDDLVNDTPEQLYEKYEVNGFWKKRYMDQVRKISKNPADAIYFVLTGFSWVAILFIPLMALWMKLVYLRRKKYYIEHLVFTVHTTSFLFVALILLSPFLYLLDWNWTLLLLLLYPLYLLLAHRNFYGQSWLKSFVKTQINLIMGTFLLISVFLLSILFRILLF